MMERWLLGSLDYNNASVNPFNILQKNFVCVPGHRFYAELYESDDQHSLQERHSFKDNKDGCEASVYHVTPKTPKNVQLGNNLLNLLLWFPMNHTSTKRWNMSEIQKRKEKKIATFITCTLETVQLPLILSVISVIFQKLLNNRS